MAGRPGLRSVVLGALHRSALCLWLVAASVAGAVVDMPLHVRPPATGAGQVSPAPRSSEPAPPPKTEEKLIELEPWEEVPI